MSDEMVSVALSEDELYPYYYIMEGGGCGDFTVQATSEQVARWKAARDTFWEAQDEMGSLFKAARIEAQAQAAKKWAEREGKIAAAAERRQREREAKRRAEIKARNAMWKKIEASDGVLYDADGNPVAVAPSPNAHLRPPS